MAKRTKKHDPEQKNKKGFDSSKTDAEFSHEFGSANANEKHKKQAKQEKKGKNEGEWNGMH
ncbi:hypothetical protein [Bacillus kexueae]|uniref:hypothetical protein n=1 Tax=Aeribacillus kexueae TaxID=2078952 RepID=UPI001FAE9431|nr:hypothetical protein [Bacillus kexueae]